MAVQPQQLFIVVNARGLAHVMQGKVADELFLGENLLVAVGPPEPGQVIVQGVGQNPPVPVGQHRQGAVALGKLGPVFAQHQGHVGQKRRLGPQGLIDQQLPGRVADMVVPPDNMGNVHGDIVHHHRQVIGGEAVCPQDHQVIQLPVFKGDMAFDLVLPAGNADLGGFKAYRPVGSSGKAPFPAAAVIAGLFPLGQGLLAALLQILGVAVAAVGRPGLQQTLGKFVIEGQAF